MHEAGTERERPPLVLWDDVEDDDDDDKYGPFAVSEGRLR